MKVVSVVFLEVLWLILIVNLEDGWERKVSIGRTLERRVS
jgi:hypothetical protein